METKVTSIPVPHYCVVTAADIEFNAVSQQLTERSFAFEQGVKICQGRATRNHITVLQSQIGAVDFCSRFRAFLQNHKFDAVFVIGLAGALKPELKTGQVIFYDSCFLFRPETVVAEDQTIQDAEKMTACDFQLSSILRQKLVSEGWDAVLGAGLTLDFMVTNAREKLALGESSGASAVDMESHDVILTAIQMRLPTVVLRVILDEATQTTPDFNFAIKTDGRMDNLKSGLAMLLRPIAAIKFLFSLRQSSKALKKVAAFVLNAEPDFEQRSTSLVLTRRIWV